jgi:hypothetical protein
MRLMTAFDFRGGWLRVVALSLPLHGVGLVRSQLGLVRLPKRLGGIPHNLWKTLWKKPGSEAANI